MITKKTNTSNQHFRHVGVSLLQKISVIRQS